MTSPNLARTLTRRRLLQTGAGAAAAVGLAPYRHLASQALAAQLRTPDSLPDPTRPAGAPTDALPFDHIVVLMMENHSFDSYFGMLPRRGQPAADGFTFDAGGRPTNSNPLDGGYVVVEHAPSECQAHVTNAWTPSHIQVDGGAMDGFAQTAPGSMYYWDDGDLAFYYSLARTFTLANRWFGSMPGQTYPNRRYLMAGTSYGLVDDTGLDEPPPPNGTIFDRLAVHGISWRNYFNLLPSTLIIPSIAEKYPTNLAPIAGFFLDCALGTLPAVSLVDPEFGHASSVSQPLRNLHLPIVDQLGVQTRGQSEENPQDIQLGQAFAATVINAVMRSPLWPRTLLVWTYDEHGGYYDHVPPPAAIPPDSIAPRLASGDTRGGFDVYGLRVPAIVVSPYSRPAAVTNVVHDHTSILATIEAKWNLPALTYRDANAATLADFLDTARPEFVDPPALADASNVAPGEARCSTAEPHLTIHSNGVAGGGPNGTGGRLTLHFYGRRRRQGGVVVGLQMTTGKLAHLTIELRRGGIIYARGTIPAVTGRLRRVTLRPTRHGRPPRGAYTLTVRQAGVRLAREAVHLG